MDVAGAEKFPKEEVTLVPLVKPPNPLKLPPFPKPEKGVEVDPSLPTDGVRENPLKPLKVPPPSA